MKSRERRGAEVCAVYMIGGIFLIISEFFMPDNYTLYDNDTHYTSMVGFGCILLGLLYLIPMKRKSNDEEE